MIARRLPVQTYDEVTACLRKIDALSLLLGASKGVGEAITEEVIGEAAGMIHDESQRIQELLAKW